MRKSVILMACLSLVSVSTVTHAREDLAVLQAQQQAEAVAAATAIGYRFVSVCTVPAQCPSGPAPIYFGTGSNWTLAQCVSAWNIIHNGIFGQPPRTLSNCAQF